MIFAENRQTAATVRRILVSVGMFGSNLKPRGLHATAPDVADLRHTLTSVLLRLTVTTSTATATFPITADVATATAARFQGRPAYIITLCATDYQFLLLSFFFFFFRFVRSLNSPPVLYRYPVPANQLQQETPEPSILW